ncbi:MAG: protein-export chaperone SecB [Parvularculaceae bacterium]
MSETNSGADQAGGPSLAVKAQYLKDLSFENPNAPMSFQDGGQPAFEVDVNVNARGLGPNNYEVELSVSARARRGDVVAFVVETAYAGVFEIRNVPQEQIEIIMLVECPRILFPFARQIVADATRNGNYPPLMLEPIDFFAVYQRDKMMRAGQGQKVASA